MAVQGRGPRFLKLGRSVRYHRRAVLEWLVACEARYTDRYGRIHE
jgi:predicted DNA-binding transcriptional regulator AlpA